MEEVGEHETTNVTSRSGIYKMIYDNVFTCCF